MKTPSVEPVLRSRLLPRISFRLTLALMAASAVIAAIARAAGDGGEMAIAFLCALAFAAACVVLFAAVFVASWCISSLWYTSDEDSLIGSPFADGQLPPQILPPREQKS